jgi:hypothetical protein
MDPIYINELLLNDAILLAAWIGIMFLLRSVITPYVSEKGKNIATKEDIAIITSEIEKVKLHYTFEFVKSHKVVYLNLTKSLEKSYYIPEKQKRNQDGYDEAQRTNNHTGRTSNHRRAGACRAK